MQSSNLYHGLLSKARDDPKNFLLVNLPSFCNLERFMTVYNFSQYTEMVLLKAVKFTLYVKIVSRGHIFSRVQPFYEQAVSNLDRPKHRSLWF